MQGWWSIRHLPNVPLVHFNDLKADSASEIRRIAAFLDIEIDATQLPAILEHCSFDYMRQVFTDGGETFVHKGTNGRWKDVLSTREISMADEAAVRNLTRDCAHWLETGELPEENRR